MVSTRTHAKNQRQLPAGAPPAPGRPPSCLKARCAALEAENTTLRRQLDSTRLELDIALAECQRLALSACRHPAAAVDNGTCTACGTEIW
jgi:hypothetical protein